VALEISAKATLTFDVVKGQAIAWPRIESSDRLMVVGSARPMENAARIAYRELIDWIVTDYGYDRLDAYQLLTQAGTLYVGNMVDTYYSLVAGVEKTYLTTQ
jgi:amidase